MTTLDWLFGALLGLTGAGFHLWVTHYRSRLVKRGRAAASFALFAVGLLGPALAIVVGARLSAPAAWSAAFVLVTSHRIALVWLRRRLSEPLVSRRGEAS